MSSLKLLWKRDADDWIQWEDFQSTNTIAERSTNTLPVRCRRFYLSPENQRPRGWELMDFKLLATASWNVAIGRKFYGFFIAGRGIESKLKAQKISAL